MTNLKEKVPTTLREAIDILAKGLTPAEKDFINGNESARLHHLTGMAIRNNWNLWKKDSPIVKDIKAKYGIFGHGDDCSGLILAGLWTKAKGGDVEKTLRSESDRYKAHWKRSGINPETGAEIEGFKPKGVGFKKGEMQIVIAGKGGYSKLAGKTADTVILDEI